MKTIRNFVLLIILILLSNGCASSVVVENLDEKNATEKTEPEELKKERNMLPSNGCCNVNQIFKGIVVLDKICFTPTETKLTLHLTEKKKVCVLKEDMIFQDNAGNRYDLISTVGVDLCPKRRDMVKTPFSLVFPRMKEGLESFDLIESATAKHAYNPWSFNAVDVLSCEWK
ncbi:hypothetical protein [Leptospira sp. GIMC2001]|uniref:hypothetical protein n=1 Tax=Leptospira sp. GIMC2001 TaxID=1513297 RepID=UPI00234987EA|nr:hypothetical protein [Leptospira sp. GIMC2001]WCL47737.1 hypothetical protein O4O04_00335 [Leptospira sp. GIMC2001]